MKSFELVSIVTSNWNIVIRLNLFLLLALFILLAGYLLYVSGILGKRFGKDVELTIQLGGIGHVTIKPNHEVNQIAHKAWVELITRKAGLSFDRDCDLVNEIYDSWYALFKEMRELIKNIPASQLANESTEKLVEVLVDALNKGLRPHLTKWQAKFRRWYKNEIDDIKKRKLSPQEIQKKFPQYSDLVADLEKVSEQLVSYTVEIKKLV